MDIEWIRAYCLSLPRTTEKVQWGHDLVFKIGGKMYAVVNLDLSTPDRLSFKCTPEEFAELVEREGIIPAPYAARYYWVSIVGSDALTRAEIKRLIRDSYEMVLARLPKKVRASLAARHSS